MRPQGARCCFIADGGGLVGYGGHWPRTGGVGGRAATGLGLIPRGHTVWAGFAVCPHGWPSLRVAGWRYSYGSGLGAARDRSEVHSIVSTGLVAGAGRWVFLLAPLWATTTTQRGPTRLPIPLHWRTRSRLNDLRDMPCPRTD